MSNHASSSASESSWEATGGMSSLIITEDVIKEIKQEKETEVIKSVPTKALSKIATTFAVASQSSDEEEEVLPISSTLTTDEAKKEFKPTYGQEDFGATAGFESDEEEEEEEKEEIPIENWAPVEAQNRENDDEFDEENEDEKESFSMFATKVDTPTERTPLNTLLNNDLSKPVTRSETVNTDEMWTTGKFLHSYTPDVIMSTAAVELSQASDPQAAATLLMRSVLMGIHELCVSAKNSEAYSKALESIGTASRRNQSHMPLDKILSRYIKKAPNVALGTQMMSAMQNYTRVPHIDVHAIVSKGLCSSIDVLKALTSVGHIAGTVLGSSQSPTQTAWTSAMLRASASYCSSLDVLHAESETRVSYNRFVAQKQNTVPTEQPLKRMQRIAMLERGDY